jgi:hypothetical protein
MESKIHNAVCDFFLCITDLIKRLDYKESAV